MTERFGAVPGPVEAAWHHPAVATATSTPEFAGEMATWNTVDEGLKTCAHMAVAAQVGCSWRLDINYFHAQNQNLDVAKASQVPCWRTSDAFTPLERDILEYAEGMTDTPPTVTDELYARLLDGLGSTAMVELTGFIAFTGRSPGLCGGEPGQADAPERAGGPRPMGRGVGWLGVRKSCDSADRARYRRRHERHRPTPPVEAHPLHRSRASDQLAGCRRLTFSLPPSATGNGPPMIPWPLTCRDFLFVRTIVRRLPRSYA
ncbi:hypothetical protein AB0C93_05375 [Streptomyces sp. NPDC048518]|uniref:carboxymuconolactone decarboxylase family protein n=1 Tax=Streptomyces sp. NPDC048518 TaxID=3155029 RepID=UPI0033F56CF4